MKKTLKQQEGATLVVGLVMLIVLTMLVISALRSSTNSLRVVGNMQVSAESGAAAQEAIEQVISYNFTATPTVLDTTVDTDGDGTPEYTVHVDVPTCNSTKELKNTDLDATVAEDLVCMGSGTPQNTGIISATGSSGTVQSWCSKQQWDVKATATDSLTGGQAQINQGVTLRVEAGTSC
jgi:Tfp pilus assembly protein PilX